MSSNYYPAYAPSWFQPYGYKPSAYYDERAAVWYYLVLGSRNGDKATFRQYLFLLAAPYTAAIEYPLAIPIIHGDLTPAAGRLYVFGQSDRDLFWQDGPALGMSVMQKAVVRIVAPAAPPFRVLTKAQHDFLPVRDPDLFDREWERRAA
jgi:hypothetical protein